MKENLETTEEIQQKILLLLYIPFVFTVIFLISFHGKSEENHHLQTSHFTLKNSKIEKIQVTGSRIKQIDIESSSPILVIDKDDIEKTGYNSVADVLRDLTVNSFGSDRESSGKAAPGTSGVSLRGLGANRTLVLLDGKRIPKDPFRNAVDLNLIPLVAVERIDILKDNASPVYGSDALGGVVNIITRKDFHGSKISAKQFVSEESGGNQTTVDLTSGYSHPRLNVTGTIFHRFNEAIYARERNYSKLALSQTGSPGTFRILKGNKKPYRENKALASRSQWRPAPGCPSDRTLQVTGGKVCQYNYADHMTTRPKLTQTSATLNINFEVIDEVVAFIRLSGTHRETYQVFPPSLSNSSLGLDVSGKQAKTYISKGGPELEEAFSQLQDNDFVDIKYRLLELGDRQSEVTTHQYNALTGATIELMNSWEVEASVSYSQNSMVDLGINGFIHSDDLKKRLSENFNPFAPTGQRGKLADLNYRTRKTSRSDLALVEVFAQGEICQMSSGPLSMAVGSQMRKEALQTNADEELKSSKIVGNSGQELYGQRNVTSYFIEFSVPLVSSLEWGLSGRYDSYSDFGRAFSPKTSLLWKASPHVMVRSSVGQGFKAPDMDALYRVTSNGYENFIDQSLCKKNGGTDCLSSYKRVISSGNPHLQKEGSLSVSLGTVIQPSESLSLSIDGWYLKLKNQVGIDYGDATLAEDIFGTDYVKGFGVTIYRDDVTGTIKKIAAPEQNLSETEASGVDFSTDVFTQTKMGNLLFNVQHSHLFYMKSVGFPGLRKRDKLGQFGHPPWRNVISLSLSPTNHQLGTITARTVAPHEKLSSTKGTLKRYTEFDLQYSYVGSWGGIISTGVRNLLGTTPPIDDSNPNSPNIATYLYDGNGRIGWIQYGHSF